MHNIYKHDIAMGLEGVVQYSGNPWFEERFYQSYVMELRAFVHAVKKRKQSSPSIIDGINALIIAEASKESAIKNRCIEVELEQEYS